MFDKEFMLSGKASQAYIKNAALQKCKKIYYIFQRMWKKW